MKNMYSKNRIQYETSLWKCSYLKNKRGFSAKAFCSIKILCCNFSFGYEEQRTSLGEVRRLEVCVCDWDSSQLNYLGVTYAPAVVASRDGLVIADIEAGPCNTHKKKSMISFFVFIYIYIYICMKDFVLRLNVFSFKSSGYNVPYSTTAPLTNLCCQSAPLLIICHICPISANTELCNSVCRNLWVSGRVMHHI